MIAQFIGVKYENRGRDIATGCDCWGLLREFYRRVLEIDLPSYEASYKDAYNMNQTVNAIRYEMRETEWVQVDSPAFGDGVLLRVAGHPCHVGVYIGEERMIHTLTGHDSAIDVLDGVRWRNRIVGYYRHVSRIEKYKK